MVSKYHDDWQSSKKTVLQRNAYMFDNELMSDVSFTCGESCRIIHAHKYVLATSSVVFFAMFHGGLPQEESPIHMADAQEESFLDFLRFLYTDDCTTTADNALGVLYLAKKYLVSSLAGKCCETLVASIRPENVFVLLEQARGFDAKRLEEKCWDIVLQNTQECINSDAFCDVGSLTLNDLLQKERLTVAEVNLFKAVMRWTDTKCALQGINIEEDKTARRRILGNSVYKIRFLAMSQEDILKDVSPTGILTNEEIVCILQKLAGLDVPDFKWKERENRQHAIFTRFECGNIIPNTNTRWIYSGCSDALTLMVNKTVLLNGVRLFGDTGGSQYEVEFNIKDVTITEMYTSKKGSDGIPAYDVMLPKPIFLQPGEEITMTAKIRGPNSYYGEDGKLSVNVDGIVVTFKNAPSGRSSNNTDDKLGQFFQIYLSKL